MTKKKKVLFCSDFSKLKTGFGRNAREVLMHLWNTGKYDIVEYACGPLTYDDAQLKTVPWKAYGSIPTKSYHVQEVNTPALQRHTRYGGFFINEIITKEKPDIYIGVNDFWAFEGLYDKPWWNKFPCVLWVTMDSLPLFKPAIENANKIKNFWVWSEFAEKEFKRLGFDHVKTVHGALDAKTFFPFAKDEKQKNKQDFGINGYTIFGFVFRNQLRKLVGSLLEGFKKYQESENYKPSKLLLHTNWAEGWNIPAYIEEFKINPADVLTTYYCSKCRGIHILPFSGLKIDCKSCGGKQSCATPTVNEGPTSEQLNVIYNLMDFYIHPITSGGLEMPIVEALMAGVPVATVNYSCGEEFCSAGVAKIIEHCEYRELGTQFRKASACPVSIASTLDKFNSLNAGVRDNLSKIGREWAKENFDTKRICKYVEDFIDSRPVTNYEFKFDVKKYNDKAVLNTDEPDDRLWALKLVKDVFDIDEDPRGDTIQKMVLESQKNGREAVYKKAIDAAAAHNQKTSYELVDNRFSQSETGNMGFVSPANQQEKFFFVEILKNLYDKFSKPVIIISDEIDRQIYSQLPFVKGFLPKTQRTMNLDWLLDLKSGDKPRFDMIFFQEGNEFKYKEQNNK